MENGNVYCQFVDATVDRNDLHRLCPPVAYVSMETCTACPRSPQLDVGGSSKKLLEQMKDR